MAAHLSSLMRTCSTSILQAGCRRRIAIIGAATAVLLAFLPGCGPSANTYTVQWRTPKPELTEKAPVRYAGTQIGRVEKITPDGSGVAVQIAVARKHATAVRSNATFVVQSDAPGAPPYVALVPLDRTSPQAVPGTVFEGSDSRGEVLVRTLVTDWRRTAVAVGVGLAGILVAFLVSKLMLKLWLLAVCAGFGLACAYYLSLPVQELLTPYLPEGIQPDIAARIVAFLGGYVVGTFVLAILARPFRKART